MELLMNNLQVKISNEEFYDVDKPCIANSQGIVKFIKRYEKGHILTYYISYEEDEKVLDGYNQYLSTKNMPVFNTYNARNLKTVVDIAISVIMVLLFIRMPYRKLFIECAL